ncbi:helix-turn-helix transcriptional regulator [Streptomyces sp. NBC_00083]|uniref:helix-turn-helix transcriptional regulator n=1 Tax=Streptomyces sp. NBC_00083 TaxID=2975647 RepID=UPI002255E11F|nr:helix-turn-helix transcriptional regulator [Streptomyces sp. NBC_00083]MCX5384713.1 helix-turn-helix transcriptional regulator [Streptomyces sp. NBC_00083]
MRAPEAQDFRRALLCAAAAASTVPELASALSQRIERYLPHDGYTLAGLDPLTGVGCLHHDSRPAEGAGHEMPIALTHRGVVWGGLVLLRGWASRPFTPAETRHAERLGDTLALALRQYVAGKPLRPGRRGLFPGVVVIGPDDTIKGMTETAQTWLNEFVPGSPRSQDDALPHLLWGITYFTRRTHSIALSRIPTCGGWVAVHAQPLGGPHGDIALTFQSAPASQLLPAIFVWYGFTPRERAIVEYILGGLSTKRIARLLDMSPYTVSDHLRSVYRKTGTSGREELVAGLRQ